MAVRPGHALTILTIGLLVVWGIGVVFSAWPIPTEYGSIPIYGDRQRFLFSSIALCLFWPVMSVLALWSMFRRPVHDAK